jgi:hypothetical protein
MDLSFDTPITINVDGKERPIEFTIGVIRRLASGGNQVNVMAILANAGANLNSIFSTTMFDDLLWHALHDVDGNPPEDLTKPALTAILNRASLFKFGQFSKSLTDALTRSLTDPDAPPAPPAGKDPNQQSPGVGENFTPAAG